MGSPVGKAWMPMSVTRPNVDQAAFTLLELLVVLVFVGAIAAVALPGLVRMQETWARRTALDDLFNQLQTLGYRVRSDGRELLIDESGAVPEQLLRLPDGWTVTARPPIRYMANGVCLGGKLQVHHGRATHEPCARTRRQGPAGALPAGVAKFAAVRVESGGGPP